MDKTHTLPGLLNKALFFPVSYRGRSGTGGVVQMTMKYFSCMILGFLICVSTAYPANWYVRPSGGSGSGTSWTAAWNGLNNINWPSVSCGDTIWVAGGAYTETLSPAKTCSSGSRLYIKRARGDAAECTEASGWSGSYDATINHTASPAINLNSAQYVTVSGRTTSSGGDYGWYINLTARTEGNAVEATHLGSASHDTIEYVEIRGPGSINHTGDMRGFNFVGGGNGHIISHCKIWKMESAMYLVGMDDTIIEYSDFSEIQTDSSLHSNTIIQWDPSSGTIIRYNRFHDELGEGIFFEQTGGVSNVQIYGNVFYNTDKVIEVFSTVPNLKVFNNTFYNVQWSIFTGGMCGSGSEARNNLVYNSGTFGSCGTQSNNLVISSPNPFVNVGGQDFHIIGTTGSSYPRNAGTNLSAYFTTDVDGVTFGSDGTWDIGAYEYNSGGSGGPDTTPPTISAVSASSITQSSATIKWTTNESSDSQVEYGLTTSYGNSTTLNTSMVTSHSQALSGLSASKLYHYRVKSKDAAGNLAISGDYAFTTASASDTQAPTTPTNLTASAVSSSQINLTWTASTDNVGVSGYKIYRSGVQIGTSATNSYSDKSLSPSTTYSYRVSAYDAAGNESSKSTSASAKTQSDTGPAPPAGLKIE
jgi:hypothetical protein